MRHSLIAYCLIVFAAAASMAGCARPQAPEERPKPLSQDEWTSILKARSDAWQSFQAQLRIKAESPKGKFNLRTILLAKLPGQYRLEAYNPFGQTMGVLVLNRSRQESHLWVPSEKVVYTATKAENLLAHFLGVHVPLETFGYSLVACIPPDQLAGMSMHPSGTEWQGSTRSPRTEWAFTWRFLSLPQALKSIDVRQEAMGFAIVYEPAVDLKADAAPERIEFRSSEWQMEVKIDQIKKTPDQSHAVFSLGYPQGIRKVNLDHGP